MGGLLNEPLKTVKHSQVDFQDGILRVHVSAVQGWRKKMEDYYIHTQIDKQLTLIGVLDGHGGPEVACYVSQILPRQLKLEPNLKLKKYDKALIQAFKRVDEMIISERGQQALKKIRKQLGIPLSTSNKKIGMEVGTTANVALITKDKIYSANIGDTRSMLITKTGVQILSQDHKPTHTYEKNRIIKSGGKVTNGRINGGLNVSRAFGDFQLKSNSKKPYNEQMVTSIPQIIEFDRNKEMQQIVIASDGVWQHFHTKNQLFAERIQSQIKKFEGSYSGFMQSLLVSLIGSTSQSDVGCDNMTLLIAYFEHK